MKLRNKFRFIILTLLLTIIFPLSISAQYSNYKRNTIRFHYLIMFFKNSQKYGAFPSYYHSNHSKNPLKSTVSIQLILIYFSKIQSSYYIHLTNS